MSYRPQTPPDIADLLIAIRSCTKCADLPLGPAPLLQADPRARILIAGQAPGRRSHERGIPFDDPSGDRLRQWLGIDRATFYNASRVAIVPMGFCYPGTGPSGDLPPKPLCAQNWRAALLDRLPNIELTLVIGRYAMDWHMPGKTGSLTETVGVWRNHWPTILPLPHPSPRNNRWLKVNPWFADDVLPILRGRVRDMVGDQSL
ncbi:MAG: uracil-DNA glycosylase family protein [Sphingobium sp.]